MTDWQSWGLLYLRLSGAVALWTFHVQHKLASLAVEVQTFPDPVGIGHAASFVLAFGAEAGCSLLVALGVLTRLACVPIVATMLMVLLLRARGFQEADAEAALLYGSLYGALALLGPGGFVVSRLGNATSAPVLPARDA
ncbi:MAG TPA: DoxX family protein [Polyangiales bacterium]